MKGDRSRRKEELPGYSLSFHSVFINRSILNIFKSTFSLVLNIRSVCVHISKKKYEKNNNDKRQKKKSCH